MADVKFIRKNGRIIPIRANSGASTSSKRRYPAVKKAGTMGALESGALSGAIAATMFRRPLPIFAAALGAAAAGSQIMVTKTRKGESSLHAGRRVSNAMNARRKTGLK